MGSWQQLGKSVEQSSEGMQLGNLNGYMKVDQLSVYLDIPVNTLRQYCSKGRIPFIKVPGSNHVRFSREAIDRWMETGSSENAVNLEA